MANSVSCFGKIALRKQLIEYLADLNTLPRTGWAHASFGSACGYLISDLGGMAGAW